MSGILTFSWIAWGAVTTIFVILMIWKSLVGLREDNVVILDPAEAKLASEQQVIVAKVERVTAWAKRFGYASLGLLIWAGAIWAYRGYLAFDGGLTP